MRLHIIGSGCPNSTADRYGSAFMIEIGNIGVLVDCGPATSYKMARMGLPLLPVGHVLFTHHHYDHNADFPAFALSRWDLCTGGEAPLRVYGPELTEAFVARLFGEGGAFYDDWRSRVEHPASHECHRMRGGALPRPAPAIEAHDIRHGDIVEGEGWTATAAHVHHVEPTLESLAFRIETANSSVVFTGDCGDCLELRELARGADTLVIACTHFGSPLTSPALTDVITGTPEVSAIAVEAGVKRVILTHASPNFSQPGVKERAIADIAQRYTGDIYFPEELTTITL